jgi:hypothetical protein
MSSKAEASILRQLYVDAVDIPPLCFKMSYLQASRRGNALSLEMFEHAVTSAFIGFYATHKDAFDD